MAFDPVAWANEHPWETGGIIVGAGLIILWMFGYIGGAKASGDGGAANMAAAYYAAEAQQAVVGAQLQATQDTNQTNAKVAGIQADAAVSINAANANASMIMNAAQYASADTAAGYDYQTAVAGFDAGTQQAGIAADVSKTLGLYGYDTAVAGFNADVTKAGYAADVAKAGYAYDSATKIAQANDAYYTSVNNNASQVQIAQTHDNTLLSSQALALVTPGELASAGSVAWSPSSVGYNPPTPGTPDWYKSHGYTSYPTSP